MSTNDLAGALAEAARLGVTFAAVQQAAERLRPHLLATPTLPCAWLSEVAGAPVSVKWESLQHTGSFKLRGALWKVTLLHDAGAREVLTVSAGNHGAGVARAARLLGMKATVVVPENAARTKVAAIRREGAALIVRGADYDAAEAAARALAALQQTAFVSPYNDPDVVVGQATALEALTADPVDVLLVPVGGGGLAAGAGLVAAALGGRTRVVGVQPAHAPAMSRALAAGHLLAAVDEAPTLADGLAGNVEAGSITFALVRALVAEVRLVDEARIADAMVGFVEHEHHVVEGSGAVGAAAILDGLRLPPGARACVVASGRNVDRARLAALLSVGP